MKKAKPELRRLLKKSGRSVASIAREAQVSVDKLSRFARAPGKLIDLDDAERVHRVLTGEGYVR